MRSFYTPILVVLLSFGFQLAYSQCEDDRYRKAIFNEVNLTSDIKYGNNVPYGATIGSDLFFDVYQGEGDTETNRAVVVMIHGGSFIAGSKTGGDVTQLARDFAKMGYVAVSMQYRLGMNVFPPDSISGTEAVIRGYHDTKAMIRYLRMDVETQGNNFGIDPDNIFLCGVSAGGFSAVHVAYLDQESELPDYVDYTKAGLGGGLEGETGNAGYDDSVKGVINLCGALRDTAWMDAGDTPILSMHAVEDGTVPYGNDWVAPLLNIPIIEVYGSHPIHENADALGIDNCFKTYKNVGGNDHVPHASDAAQYDTTLVYARNFLTHLICGEELKCEYTDLTSTDTEELTLRNKTLVFPNPASEILTIDLTDWNLKGKTLVKMVDINGILVKSLKSSDKSISITRDHLTNGLYFLHVSNGGQYDIRKIILE